MARDVTLHISKGKALSALRLDKSSRECVEIEEKVPGRKGRTHQVEGEATKEL